MTTKPCAHTILANDAVGMGGKWHCDECGAEPKPEARLRAENARQAATVAKLRTAAQNLVDFWNTLTEEQTKLTPVEADELAELESQLREALKESQ